MNNSGNTSQVVLHNLEIGRFSHLFGPTFCVTGGTGFVGSHCVKALLADGYKVRATVRDPSGEKAQFLKKLPKAENLTLVKADLTLSSADEWCDVVKGCQVVLHTASPFQIENIPAGKEEEFFMVCCVTCIASVAAHGVRPGACGDVGRLRKWISVKRWRIHWHS